MTDDKDEKQSWKKTTKKAPVKPNLTKGKKNDKKQEIMKADDEAEPMAVEIKEEDMTNELDITNMEMDFETTEVKDEQEDIDTCREK